jgi:polar amino acid transport system substrate-binding protein
MGNRVNVLRTVRRWATAAAAVASISSVPLSGVLADAVSSYTQAQADRGHKAYDANCAGCHGTTFGGSGEVPALAGGGFREHWFVGSPAPFMAFISANMPQQNPGSLDPQTYADIAAYLMNHNRVRAGDAELPTDPAALSNITLPPLQ